MYIPAKPELVPETSHSARSLWTSCGSEMLLDGSLAIDSSPGTG